MIEPYRQMLRELRFRSLDEAALAAARVASAAGQRNNAIEGLAGTPELRALFEMFLEERAFGDAAFAAELHGDPHHHPIHHAIYGGGVEVATAWCTCRRRRVSTEDRLASGREIPRVT